MADSKELHANKGTQAERLVQLRRDKGMTAEQLAREPHAGGLFTFRVDVPGLIAPPFAG